MTGGLPQSVPRLQNTWASLPSTADPVTGSVMLNINWGKLPAGPVQFVDRDPLSHVELTDLRSSEEELRLGRYTTIAEDVSDEDLFRFLDSD